ncbi:type IV secretory system conjugative DNA transfer family protein [Dactylosporangium sp. NPDC000521]|uniref:type IV secretory system conjugative DNA transfer family protein n=1 Tax=Dactylosporangium sp. NPDC000521 TaxID=3363975 RepID=UPI0036BFAB89
MSGSDLALAGLLGVVGFASIGIWLSGQVAGLVFRFTWPDSTIGDAFTIVFAIPKHLADPRLAWPVQAQQQLPGPAGFYTATVFVVAVLLAAAVAGFRAWGAGRQAGGMASRQQLDKTMTARAVLRRASRIRPSLTGQATLADVAVELGTAGRTALYAGLESSVLVVAPPRQGKTSQVIIPWLRTFPGAAVVTSVRADVLEATATLRGGTSWLMNLDPVFSWPDQITWTPVAGAEDYDIARQRADVMIQVGKQDAADSSNAGFFGLTATNLLAAWLHTAALCGRTMQDVLHWSTNPTDDSPVKLLRDADGARPGVVKMLDGFYRQPDATRSNLWTTVQTGTSCLFGPAAAAVFCGPAADSFDIERFLRSGADTLYLVVDEKKADAFAPLVTAFVNELITTAVRLAKLSPNGRLDPPLGLILDEATNVVPLPDLPQLMSYTAGFGIFTATVMQSLAAAEDRWRAIGRKMLWSHATIKIALGGLAGDDLDDFSKLAGMYRETLLVPQHHRQHGMHVQASVVDRKTMAPDAVRTLDEDRREALVIHATTPAVITRMVRHFEGPHRQEYEQAVTDARQKMGIPQKLTGTDASKGSARSQTGDAA